MFSLNLSNWSDITEAGGIFPAVIAIFVTAAYGNA